MRIDEISECVCSELTTIRGSLGKLKGVTFLQTHLWPNSSNFLWGFFLVFCALQKRLPNANKP